MKKFIHISLLQPSSDVYLKILAGDEVIQVNDQIVVSTERNVCIGFFYILQGWKSFYRFASSGWVEQSEPHKEAAGESQRRDSGPEEDPRVSAA